MHSRRISILGFLVLVFVMVELIRRRAILATTPATILAQVAAVLLMVWARMSFGLRSFHAAADPTEGGLITSGPYRYVRHPIYASVLLFVAAATLCHLSGTTILLAAAAAFGVALRIHTEERLLIDRYPDYALYAARTRRIIPFLL